MRSWRRRSRGRGKEEERKGEEYIKAGAGEERMQKGKTELNFLYTEVEVGKSLKASVSAGPHWGGCCRAV